MKSNLEHSTFNIQPRRIARFVQIGRWKLNVECWMFPLAILFQFVALPLCGHTNAITTNATSVLVPPYGELPPTIPEQLQAVTAQHPISVALAGLGTIALAVLGVWLVFRPRSATSVPPAVQAQQKLDTLRRQPEDGAVLSRISQVVQNYFIAAFQLPPGELTTTEFSDSLSGHEAIGKDLSMAVIRLLRDCDDRKFSTARALAPLDAANQGLKLVAQAEQRRNQSSHRNANPRPCP